MMGRLNTFLREKIWNIQQAQQSHCGIIPDRLQKKWSCLCIPVGDCASSCSFLNISIFYLFSFHQNSLANLNPLFLVPHVALGGRPDFTSDMKNHTKKQTLFVFIRDRQRNMEMTTVAMASGGAGAPLIWIRWPLTSFFPPPDRSLRAGLNAINQQLTDSHRLTLLPPSE